MWVKPTHWKRQLRKKLKVDSERTIQAYLKDQYGYTVYRRISEFKQYQYQNKNEEWGQVEYQERKLIVACFTRVPSH